MKANIVPFHKQEDIKVVVNSAEGDGFHMFFPCAAFTDIQNAKQYFVFYENAYGDAWADIMSEIDIANKFGIDLDQYTF
jgi:hypothetical protein